MKLVFASIWMLLWAASLALPAAIMGPLDDNVFPGWAILFIGWMGPLVGQFGWVANLVLPVVIILSIIRNPPIAVSFVVAAFQAILIVNALFWRKMYGDDGAGQIVSFGLGYYIWFCAMVGSTAVLLIRSFSILKSRKTKSMSEPGLI